jgi:uncharacterized protein (TIGR03663 family)
MTRTAGPVRSRGLGSAAFFGLVAASLALALAFRLAGLDLRPMHHDEANQAVKFGTLLETGDYLYDRNDHHGPTLYYLTLPAAWIRGQASLASLDERTLRAVPAVFGAALILLLLPLARDVGRPAVAAGALLLAISPAFTYYSRFYIQEMLFVSFALGYLVALGRYVQDRRAAWAAGAGVFAGLAYATKETSVIILITAVAAAIGAAAWSRRPGERIGGWRAAHGILGAGGALLVAFVLYSSFFRYPMGFLESFRAFGIYAARGIEAGPHAHPWYYYLHLLAYSSSGGLVWTEGFVLALALVGLIAAGLRARPTGVTPDVGRGFSPAEARGALQTRPRFWLRYLALYSLLTALAFSIIRYKTPWNLLPFYAGFVVLAGCGAAWLIGTIRPPAARALLILALLAGACHLGIESWRADFQYPVDPRNPYVYAQTGQDFLRLVRRVMALAAVHGERRDMLVKVVAAPHEQWPLPWYLRRMTRVGYWVGAADAGTVDDAPVIVASQENVKELDAALGDRYVSEFYGLRPNVLLTLYIERSLWEQFLESP